jgi:hypothetical protein
MRRTHVDGFHAPSRCLTCSKMLVLIAQIIVLSSNVARTWTTLPRGPCKRTSWMNGRTASSVPLTTYRSISSHFPCIHAGCMSVCPNCPAVPDSPSLASPCDVGSMASSGVTCLPSTQSTRPHFPLRPAGFLRPIPAMPPHHRLPGIPGSLLPC